MPNILASYVDKTKCMLMGSKQKLKTTENSDKSLNLEVQGHKIEQVTDHKLLGIPSDNSLYLEWTDHKGQERLFSLYCLY